jgi:hypothetical protein
MLGMDMKNLLVRICASVSIVFLGGCALPKLDTSKFAVPKSVVIHEIPTIRPIVILGPVNNFDPEFYFSRKSDPLFVFGSGQPSTNPALDYPQRVNPVIVASTTQPVSTGMAVGMGVAAGIAGAIVQMRAEELQREAADFPEMVRKTLPADLSSTLGKALRESLEAKGIQVSVDPETRNMPPRPRWAGTDNRGRELVPGALAASPPVDADLLVQVSPAAFYEATALASVFKRKVAIAITVFNGRTREFAGWQIVRFSAPDSKFEYFRYEELAADIQQAGPALAAALLSLVPEITRVISREGG